AQQGVPLTEIGRRAHIRNAGQQEVVFDIEKARRLVSAFKIPSYLVEVPSLITEKGSFRDAGVGLARLFYGGEQRREVSGRELRCAQCDKAVVEDIELHPHLGRDQRP